jgi:hypothetical protein
LLDRTKNGKEKTEITDFNEKWVIKVWDEWNSGWVKLKEKTVKK